MNTIIIKQAIILAAVLGAIVALVALISPLMMYVIFTVLFLLAPLVIVFMKRRKMLGYLTPQQGAILGAVVGAGGSLGFFAVFVPLVLLLGFVFKLFHGYYYTYGIQWLLNFGSLWLLVLILVSLGATIAVTNAVSAMGVMFVYNQIEPKPKETGEGSIDIKVE